MDKTPEIYLALEIDFDVNCNEVEVISQLEKIGIRDYKIVRPKFGSPYVRLAIVHYEPFWYLDDAISKMFSKIDTCLLELKELSNNLKLNFLVDVAIVHYGTFPAIEFLGENMEKIRFLEADISVDIQCC